MLDYKVLLEQKAEMPDVDVIQQDIDSSTNSRIRPWSGKYAGIIVGPCPHTQRL